MEIVRLTIIMSKKSLIAQLKRYSELNLEAQIRCSEDILKTFKEFWNSKPTEDEFKQAMHGIIIMPEMMYYMVKNSG